MTDDPMIVPAPLVKHVRTGLLRQIGFAAELLAELTPPGVMLAPEQVMAYRQALEQIAAAHSLLEVVGVLPSVAPEEAVFRRDQHPQLLVEALRSELAIQTVRLESAEREGLIPGVSSPSMDDIALLDHVVVDFQRRLGIPHKSTRQPLRTRSELRLGHSGRSRRRRR